MAYDAKYFLRTEQTNNPDKTLNVKAGNVTAGIQSWSFNALADYANNSKVNVQTADYFIDAYGILSVGDFITVACNDGATLLSVATSAVGGVTVISVDLA